jgi:hypothetical protein
MEIARVHEVGASLKLANRRPFERRTEMATTAVVLRRNGMCL